MSNFFTADNTNGFSQGDLDMMNKAVAILLNGSADADDIKNACDEVSDNFEEGANLPLLVLGRGLMASMSRAQTVSGVEEIINSYPRYADALAGLYAHQAQVERFEMASNDFEPSDDHDCDFDVIDGAEFDRSNAEAIAQMFDEDYHWGE